MSWDFTFWDWTFGVACTLSGWLLGMATPRIWRFMNTTFGGA